MPQPLLDKSGSTMPRAIQRTMIAYMKIFSGPPDTAVADTRDVFWFVSHKPAPGNIILRTHFSGDIERQIDTLLTDVGQHLDEIGWFVFPHDTPADLGARLQARGMQPGPGGNWLWLDLRTLGAPPAVPHGFRIERVTDDAMMAEWTRASEAGFGGEYPNFYEAYARHGYGADAFSLHYIGFMGDTAVTSGTLLEAGGAATVFDLSTPPVFRGRGFGGALTHFMLREILRRGYDETYMWSSDMALSLYRSLGFVDADFGLREYVWRKEKHG